MLFHMELSDLEYLLMGKSKFFSWCDNMLIGHVTIREIENLIVAE